ncbi:MAG: hypothetical protein PHR61_00750 [Candidatus Absconditabacteria bacterium]|nr:hypothetical protein [Candidatus Absconditabacteria bacterium]
MKSLKGQLKKILVLCIVLGITSTTFADNVIGDVPSSANENRTLNRETTIYNGTCDITQDLAFYDGSPVYLRVGQPKGPVSYVFDKTETYIRGYNQATFVGDIKFPYVANFVPSTSIDSDSSNILTVDATGANLLGSTTIARNEPAGQFVTFNNERSVIQNANGVSLNYYYIRANDLSLHNGSLNVIINPNLTTKISCTNYYVARCGDGVIDKETGTSDGLGGLTNQLGTFLPWHGNSIKPNEICDDGAENGQAGKCKIDCSGIGDGTETGSMIVTKTLTVEQNYAPQDTLQFRISFSNPGSQILENVSIEDFLPSGLEYVSSEINGVTNVLFSTGDVGGNLRIAYTGFNLAAGQNGYILINAKLLACNAALNIVNRSALSNGQTISGNTTKQVLCATDPVSISKTANPNTIQGGQTVRFTITANNATPNTITDVRVEDIWPSCFSLIEGSVTTNIQATQNSAGNMTQWTLPNGLTPGQSFVVSFSGLANSNPSCVGTHTNTGKIIFTDGQGIAQTQTNTNVIISQPSYNLQVTKTASPEAAGPGDIVRFTIRYRNNGTAPLQGFRIIDYRPNTIQYMNSILIGTNTDLNPITTNEGYLVWNFPNTILGPGQEYAIEVIGQIK